MEDSTDGGRRAGPEARLRALGVTLPAVPIPTANYVTAVRVGSLLFVAGHGPERDGTPLRRGKLGREISTAEGYRLARQVALDILAATRAAVGSLDRVMRVVHALGLVASAEGFGEQPGVINGFSDVMVEAFGDAGRHARSTAGVAELAGGMPLEIEAVLEIRRGAAVQSRAVK